MKPWYESLFENYAEQYDKESFVQGTAGECDFIEQEIGGDKSARILDIGCGTGRHCIELAKRGYPVTGVDLSDAQLRRAREKARAQAVEVDFRKMDARNLPFKGEFDLAVMLCEGGFALMETDEMNFEILRSATSALKDHGKFIFTTLNALFPLHHSVKRFCAASGGRENAAYRNNAFDLMTFRDRNTIVFEDDSGNKKEIESNERFYAPSEITWLLKSLGCGAVEIFGAKLGAFSRNDRLTTGDFEMLVVCQASRGGFR